MNPGGGGGGGGAREVNVNPGGTHPITQEMGVELNCID